MVTCDSRIPNILQLASNSFFLISPNPSWLPKQSHKTAKTRSLGGGRSDPNSHNVLKNYSLPTHEGSPKKKKKNKQQLTTGHAEDADSVSVLGTGQFCKSGSKEHDLVIWVGDHQCNAGIGHGVLEESAMEECVGADGGDYQAIEG